MQTRYARSTAAACVLLASAALVACDQPAETLAPLAHVPQAARVGAPSGGEEARALAALRQATARFHDIEAAQAAGYDTQITPCWAHSTAGAMGYHFGKPDLLDDADVNLLEPELVLYEPQRGGGMRLVGFEYLVFLDQWEAAGHDLGDPDDVPELLGREFTRHSFLPVFKLHIWLWRHNPAGLFADWNPQVSCAYAAETETF